MIRQNTHRIESMNFMTITAQHFPDQLQEKFHCIANDKKINWDCLNHKLTNSREELQQSTKLNGTLSSKLRHQLSLTWTIKSYTYCNSVDIRFMAWESLFACTLSYIPKLK